MSSAAKKRILQEAKELRHATDQYHAYPLEDNIFEWHFTIAGPKDSEFDGGRFHGRILLPNEYPMKPPSIVMLTPNGRFEVGRKICLSISAHHPESWQPSWSIRTMLMAVIAFLPTPGNGAIGALDYTEKERNKLATKSVNWKCPTCEVHMAEALATTRKATELKGAELAAFNEMQSMGFGAPTPRSRTTTESSAKETPTQAEKESNDTATTTTTTTTTRIIETSPETPDKAPKRKSSKTPKSSSKKSSKSTAPPQQQQQQQQQQQRQQQQQQPQPSGWSGFMAVVGVIYAIGFLVYRKHTRAQNMDDPMPEIFE